MKCVPLCSSSKTDEEYLLDEVMYKSRSEALLNVEHNMDALKASSRTISRAKKAAIYLC
jgi:hypothetical protein